MNIPENFDRWMFDYKEGNLSGAEKEAFENYLIQHPEFEIEADAWSNAYIANEDFVYPHADALQKDRKVAVGWYAWSAAAVALILIGSSIFFNSNNSSNPIGENGLSGVSKEKNVKTISTTLNNTTDESENIETSEIQSEVNTSNNGLVASSTLSALFGSTTGSQSNEVGGQFGIDGNLNENDPTIANGTGNLMAHLDNNDGHETFSDPSAGKASFDQEVAKYDGYDYKAKYKNNPHGKELEFDITKNQKFNSNNWQNKIKSMYRKIERMFDYPVGLTNLRDPELLLPNTNIVAFNPAFTGGMLLPRFEMNYRNQWFGNEQNSQQLTMSFDNYIYEMRGGVGLMINAKDYGYGEFNDVNMSLTYSPKILLSPNIVFEPAVKMTLGLLNANGNKLAADSQFELERGRVLSTPAAQQMQDNSRLWYKDYGLGFVLNTKWFYAGFSADNLNRHFENVYNVEGYATPTSSPLMVSGIVGTDYDFKRRPKDKPMSISPFVAYQQFGQRQELWAGFNYRLNSFTVGGSISHLKDFTASVGMKFEKFKLIYSYDHTTSTLNNAQIGSHNIGIRFNGSDKKKRL